MLPRLRFSGTAIDPAELDDERLRVAAGLHRQDVREGAAVAAMLRNSPAHVALVLACRAAGIYLVEINWHFKAGEVAHLLADSGARLLFVQSDLLDRIEPGIPAGVGIVIVDPVADLVPDPAADSAAGAAARSPIKPRDRAGCRPIRWEDFGVGDPPMPPRIGLPHATIAYTSGTTGRPKGVRRLPAPPEARAEREAGQRTLNARIFGATADSTVLLSAPIYHSAPMSYLVHACNVGATLLLEASFDAERTLALISRHRVTHAYLVPTMFQRLLALDAATRARYDVSSVRQVTSTGSPCAPDLKRRMIDWWGPVITEAYASSETGYITFIDSADWLAHPGSAGRAVGAARIRILDESGREMPPGAVGLIYACQPVTPDFTYLNNDEARRALERDGLFTLGDIGTLDADGYLFICDRKADMVISGGANIYPAEIEAVLQTMPGVADCAVFGIPDPEFGEVLAAAVQPASGTSAEAVRAFLRERIAGFKVPRVVTFHAQLPREETGKIFKRQLREPYWLGHGRSI